jgi:hypothetical protein
MRSVPAKAGTNLVEGLPAECRFRLKVGSAGASGQGAYLGRKFAGKPLGAHESLPVTKGIYQRGGDQSAQDVP